MLLVWCLQKPVDYQGGYYNFYMQRGSFEAFGVQKQAGKWSATLMGDRANQSRGPLTTGHTVSLDMKGAVIPLHVHVILKFVLSY